MYSKVRDHWIKHFEGHILVNVVRKADMFPLIADVSPLGIKDASSPREVNRLLNETTTSIVALNLFPNTLNNVNGYITQNYTANRLYCTGGVPILNDAFIHKTLTKIEELPTFTEILATLNKANRYITYDIPLVKSRKDKIANTLSDIVGVIVEKTYANYTCLYLKMQGKHALLDQLAISFYKLTDVIPIFNTTKSEGIAMEVLLTNSLYSWPDSITYNYYFIARIAFSKYEDNLLVIDGEHLDYDKQQSAAGALDAIGNTIYKHSPDDSYLKEKKERTVCAE